MMKKMFSLLVLFSMLCGIWTNVAVSAEGSASDILGTWYGQYTGTTDDIYVERYMNMSVKECDENGNISGEARVTTVEGQGHDSEWFNYEFEGTFDFSDNAFYMKGVKLLDGSSSTNWSFISFNGVVSGDNITGIVDNNEERKFSFARVSEWAKDEVTEANALGLIPDVLQGEDLSQKISRAEFAAVAVQLYQKLSGAEITTEGAKEFTDISKNPAKNEILKASALDIVVGISDTLYDPDSNITREQPATMLCRTIKKYKFEDWTFETDSEYYLDSEGVKKFVDDDLISEYAKPSVYYMVKMGIINGVDDTHFAPKNTTTEEEANGYASATREQAIALSLRIYNLSDLWK